MRRTLIKGTNSDQRLKSAEAAVRRLQRKTYNQRVSSYISPFPVSFYISKIPEDGVVLRYMFPGEGRITNACIYVEGDVKKGIIISAQTTNDTGMGSGISATFRKNFNKFSLDMYVNTGDMLSIILPTDMNLGNVWVAFLWLPDISEVEVKSFLARELEVVKEEISDEGV
jgi:hypothetical protein